MPDDNNGVPLRYNITFSQAAAQWLAAEAERRGTTATDIIRRVVDEARGDYISRRRETP